ncbi:hypothetical protein EJB05_28961 [Eragrostis curvula]|uniref:F-box domain-containing protein n=1 Tax=Eragrostis curvula TaxID=38414 RepID=A0A5J9USA4_9POAL|nr:hypothetical protein EJB05_28961 [Eragrostis curvula]
MERPFDLSTRPPITEKSAHHPFDRMAQESRAKKTARSDQEDRLSALPDGALQHILGFLPAHEVVRTSVLAGRWGHIWKSVRRLHITSPPVDWDEDEDNSGALYDFVNPLFLFRGHAILDEVKFDFDPNIFYQTDIWVRYTLLCQAQVLAIRFPGSGCLEDRPLVSSHLRKLELTGVFMKGKFLDFARCPALEVLDMTDCKIVTKMTLSQSMKILHIESSTFISYGDRTHISVPSLIWLQLNNFKGQAPLLESMPSLETASVKPVLLVKDSCEKGDSRGCCGICANCRGNDDHKGSCVLLGGLSSAVNLELTAYSGMMQRAQFGAEIGRKDSSMEKFAISGRLKIVKIECEEVDDRVCKLLKFLSTLDIEVTIKRKLYASRGLVRPSDWIRPSVGKEEAKAVKRGRASEAAMPSGVDRISALPDGVLEHVLGFLPADRAVQTSVLARCWRHLWRSM